MNDGFWCFSDVRSDYERLLRGKLAALPYAISSTLFSPALVLGFALSSATISRTVSLP